MAGVVLRPQVSSTSPCDSHTMTVLLEQLATAVAARAETWTRLGLEWLTGPISPNHGKPVVRSEFQSPSWLAEIMIWCTRETELSTVRLTDSRVVNKHYDLTGGDDLDQLLDDPRLLHFL